MDDKTPEQRLYCKFRAQFGCLSSEIHHDSQKAYGSNASKYSTVCKWVHCFKEDRESIDKNEPRGGRSISVVADKKVVND